MLIRTPKLIQGSNDATSPTAVIAGKGEPSDNHLLLALQALRMMRGMSDDAGNELIERAILGLALHIPIGSAGRPGQSARDDDRISRAVAAPGAERLREFHAIGPAQRAAVETFADALATGGPAAATCSHPDAHFCPASGQDECPDCGGFDVCCGHPELHRPRTADAPCDALGAPEDGIELRCGRPAGHQGAHSFIVTPAKQPF